MESGNLIFNKRPGDAIAAGPQTTLCFNNICKALTFFSRFIDNWQIILCKFNVYNVMISYTHMYML